MAAQKYVNIGSGSTWPLSVSPNPALGYFLQGPNAILSVGPDHSNHTVALVAQQGAKSGFRRSGEVVDKSSGNLTLTHGVSLTYGHLTIANEAGGTVTLDGASTVANSSALTALGGPGPFAAPGSFVLNGSLTVSNQSTADFRDAALHGPGTVDIESSSTVDTNTVLAGLHVNVGKGSSLILQATHPGAALSFHGTISEAAGGHVLVYGAQSAAREIFHTATGTLDLLNKAGAQIASLQFAPGSREYTAIGPGNQFAAIATSPAMLQSPTLPTIFTH